jgi:7-keto-8-aminopelargonate synthetase-like enzyme
VAVGKLQAPELRGRLALRRAQLAQGLSLRDDSAVFSVVLGDPARALATSARLRERGLLVKAIRPPTVPEGTSRLRIAVSAAHGESDVAMLVSALQKSPLTPTLSPLSQGEGAAGHE